MNQLISVIVPVYNVEKYIGRCVKSILDQSYQKLEIILVDDGSTDQSGSLCDEWERKDERIQVIHKENGGLSDARNAGIRNAKGEYLCFIDSDDYVEPQMIQVLYENLVASNADMSVCEFEKQQEGNEADFPCDGNHSTKEYEGEELLALLYSKEFLNRSTIVVAWNKLYKRELFDGVWYPVGRLHEDEYVIHRLLYKAGKLVYTPQKFYHYMQREQSIMSSFSEKKIWDMLAAYEERISFFLQIGKREYAKLECKEWLYKAKKSYKLCEQKKPEDYKEIQKSIKTRSRRLLLKMHKEYIIVGMSFWKEFLWTICP